MLLMFSIFVFLDVRRPLLCKILIDMKYTKYPNQYLYEMKTEMNYNKNMDFRYLFKPLN